jgi:uncharacterized protein (TIGR02217 family)
MSGVTIINARLTDHIESGAMCYASRWLNTRLVGVNGLPSHNGAWSRPIGRWDIATGMQNTTWGHIQSVIDMHMVTRGGRDGFLFRDPSDFFVIGELVGTGDGTRKDWQLSRTYSNSGGSFVRVITRPIAASLTVRVNGTPLPESGWVVSETTGVLTLDAAPTSGHGVSVDFQYLKAVAFEQDELPIEVQTKKVMGAPSIPLTEIPEA